MDVFDATCAEPEDAICRVLESMMPVEGSVSEAPTFAGSKATILHLRYDERLGAFGWFGEVPEWERHDSIPAGELIVSCYGKRMRVKGLGPADTSARWTSVQPLSDLFHPPSNYRLVIRGGAGSQALLEETLAPEPAPPTKR